MRGRQDSPAGTGRVLETLDAELKHSQGYLYAMASRLAEHRHPSNLLDSKIANLHATRGEPELESLAFTSSRRDDEDSPTTGKQILHLATSLRSPTSHNHLPAYQTISLPPLHHPIGLNKKLLKGLYTSSPSSRRCLQPKSRLSSVRHVDEFTLLQVSRSSRSTASTDFELLSNSHHATCLVLLRFLRNVIIAPTRLVRLFRTDVSKTKPIQIKNA